MVKTRRSRRNWSSLLVIILFCIAAAQFVRPVIANPPVTRDIAAPPEVEQVLRKSCYNCHSNETRLAWFDRLTPANWLVAGHIRDGRRALNFSEWDSLTRDQQKTKLFESLYQAERDAMPLSQYLLLHPGSKITAGDIAVLKNYLGAQTPSVTFDTARTGAADRQFRQWIAANPSPAAAPTAANPSPPSAAAGSVVQPEFNGIPFQADFSNWRSISTTERFDNGTTRAILGNDAAIRAISDHHTNPWPDGVAFAKVAWAQSPDMAGNIHTGEFRQVEFMIKDKNKYASSEGWGFARWVKGLQLAPYGKDALFVTECANCHRPMASNDFVFTIPLHPHEFSLPDSSASKPLEGKVITTIVDKKNKTLSTLYGNDIAVQAARRGHTGIYPPGSVLSFVTWTQQADPHYFGANIPGAVRSVEKISFGKEIRKASPQKDEWASCYEIYEGTPLKRQAERNAGNSKNRMAWILALRASVMP
jgi:hypothetical protein